MQTGVSTSNKCARAARNARYLTWAMHTKIQMPVSGYVWEDSGRITGNVSLMPVNKDGSRAFMIANVAVHPDYRRLGIGRVLTEQAPGILFQSELPVSLVAGAG